MHFAFVLNLVQWWSLYVDIDWKFILPLFIEVVGLISVFLNLDPKINWISCRN